MSNFELGTEVILEEKIHRWMCLNDIVREKTFYSVELQEFSGLNSRFESTRFIECQFHDSTLNYTIFENCVFEKVSFDQVIIRNTQFKNCQFLECQVRPLDVQVDSIHELKFTNCYFKRCDFEKLADVLLRAKAYQSFQKCFLVESKLDERLIEDSHSGVVSKLVLKEETSEPKLTPPSSTQTSNLIPIPAPQQAPKSGTKGRFGQLEIEV